MKSETATNQILSSLPGKRVNKIDVDSCCLPKLPLQGVTSFLYHHHSGLACHADAA